jgi:hypothetical protein
VHPREFNKGIFRFSAFFRDSCLESLGNFNGLQQNSLRNGTGNVFRGTGNFLERTGNFRKVASTTNIRRATPPPRSPTKNEIRKRLGRSPDDGDAIVMCLAEGAKAAMRQQWAWDRERRPEHANVGHAEFKRRLWG